MQDWKITRWGTAYSEDHDNSKKNTQRLEERYLFKLRYSFSLAATFCWRGTESHLASEWPMVTLDWISYHWANQLQRNRPRWTLPAPGHLYMCIPVIYIRDSELDKIKPCITMQLNVKLHWIVPWESRSWETGKHGSRCIYGCPQRG